MGERDASWDTFCNQLDDTIPAYGVFDIEWTDDDGRLRDGLAFVSWIPDNCSIKLKFPYGSTQDSFKEVLGCKFKIVAKDVDDLADEYAAIVKK